MKNKKLIWYILPTYFIIILISLVPVSIYTFNQVRSFYIDKKISELKERAYLVENQVDHQLQKNTSASLDSICRQLGEKSHMRITIILKDGRVIGDSDFKSDLMDNHASRPEVQVALNSKVGSSIRYSDTIEKDLLYVAVPFQNTNNFNGVIRTSVALTYIESTLQTLQSNLIYAGIVIALFAALISIFVARRITNPINEMKQGVEKFASGDLAYRLPDQPSSELAKLAESLNEMAAQLDDKMKEIVEQKNEQQAVLESMVEGVLAVDKKKNILNFNQAAADMFDIDDNAIGNNIKNYIKNKDLQKLITKALNQNNPVEEDIEIKRKQIHYLQGNGTGLKNAQGKIVGALIVLNDVTRLRRLENIRQDFVANVSHEIRTPLTSIKGFAETLLDGAIKNPKEAKNFVEIIANQSERLNAIIEDLLMLARLEQEGGREKLDFSEVSLITVLQSAAQVCAPAAKKKHIKIKLDIDKKLKLKINPALFEQAIVNLVDNAIKYSPEQKNVCISTKNTKKYTQIIVSDQGAGIEKHHLPRLFERFYRVDKARSRSVGGTGLGLAIVKHIAQVHDGKVSVESTPGSGTYSKFIFHCKSLNNSKNLLVTLIMIFKNPILKNYLNILFINSILICAAQSQNINTGFIKKHLEYLASDSCQGRAVGSPGEQRAANYIQQKLLQYKIKPIGENNSYFQRVPMHGSTPLPNSDLKLYFDSTEHSLILNKDYLLYKSGASVFLPAPLPMVFVGYGIIAPEFDYNDYQDIDVEGKIVVFISGEPISDDPEYFNGPIETIYSNADAKQRIAISRGASGSIMLLKPEDREWSFWQRQFQFEDVSLSYSVSSNLNILLNPDIAKDIFQYERYNLKKIFEFHQTNRMISFDLTSQLSIKSFFKQRDFIAKNVIGLLEGNESEYRDSYVLLSAHFDHLGIGPAIQGDSIYNGTFDNAAGVAVLLEITRNLSIQNNLLKRSIIFLFTTGEEKGLLGSTYYTDHPVKPLYKTIANINIDGISSFDETNDFIAFGLQYSNIGTILNSVLADKSLDLYISPETNIMELESINRSDHFAFAKAGIPFLILLEGLNYRNTSKELGYRRLIDWQNTIYHTPFDDLNQPINYAAVKQHTELLLDLCFAISNTSDVPQWKKDSPFLLRRLQSIAERR